MCFLGRKTLIFPSTNDSLVESQKSPHQFSHSVWTGTKREFQSLVLKARGYVALTLGVKILPIDSVATLLPTDGGI